MDLSSISTKSSNTSIDGSEKLRTSMQIGKGLHADFDLDCLPGSRSEIESFYNICKKNSKEHKLMGPLLLSIINVQYNKFVWPPITALCAQNLKHYSVRADEIMKMKKSNTKITPLCTCHLSLLRGFRASEYVLWEYVYPHAYSRSLLGLGIKILL